MSSTMIKVERFTSFHFTPCATCISLIYSILKSKNAKVMFAQIASLESTFDALLPARRLTGSPEKALLEAARAWSEEVWRVSGILGPLPLSPEQLRQGLRLAQQPVFICGVHRSGTTLLRDLLDGHADLLVLPAEGSFLTNLAARFESMPAEQGACFLATEWLRRLANPINQPPYWLLGRSSPDASAYVDFARAFRAWYRVMEENFSSRTSIWPHLAVLLAYASSCGASAPGLAARFWVDKTPVNERYLKKIWSELPQAKVIQMVRAPVDVFLSRKQMEPALNLKTCLQDLALSFRVAAKQDGLHPDKFLLMHYEALCQSPPAAISGLAGFLGIEAHACLYTPTVGGRPAQANSSFHPDLPAGGILTSQVYLHRERALPNPESQLLSAFLCRPAMQLGYPLKPMGAFSRWLVKLRLRVQYGIPQFILVIRHWKPKIKALAARTWSNKVV